MKKDELIGELQTDEKGEYRVINNQKIYQIKNNDQVNLNINKVRASGMSPSEYLKSLYN